MIILDTPTAMRAWSLQQRAHGKSVMRRVIESDERHGFPWIEWQSKGRPTVNAEFLFEGREREGGAI